MKKVIFAVAATIFAASAAQAMTYFLIAEWYSGGNTFCRYENGTILNVGVSTCPLKIQG